MDKFENCLLFFEGRWVRRKNFYKNGLNGCAGAVCTGCCGCCCCMGIWFDWMTGVAVIGPVGVGPNGVLRNGFAA